MTAKPSATPIGVRRVPVSAAGQSTHFRAFYPSEGTPDTVNIDPWQFSAVLDGQPKSGSHGLVLISHGFDGNDLGHHLLAADLVSRGFVVAAVQHIDDRLRIGTRDHFRLRAGEVSAALEVLLDDPLLGRVIDGERIGAFGYSLGGLTVLLAAGGVISLDRMYAHCATNPSDDPTFCALAMGQSRMAPDATSAAPRDAPAETAPPIPVKAIALAAPVGVPLEETSKIEAPVLLIRAEEDAELRSPFHAEHLRDLLGPVVTYEVEPVHHYAFISPFPEAIAPEVGPPALDPPGFDRAGFLTRVNARIADFFRAELAGVH